MTMNVNAVTSNTNDTPVQSSVTINKPADTRRLEERREVDKENLERAEERRVQENRAAFEPRPSLGQAGNVIGTTINTIA
jgi:hypothetical protein